ncbi:unnamed protein product [Clonostachys byssicola]|uniref:Cytochrome b2 n=1 Tax=Clonostachys byssicola TaxID=160290 RepID=A0A9N9Y9L9_9HYPO|nr:unnamed protein product [Clonostachys byssicola]
MVPLLTLTELLQAIATSSQLLHPPTLHFLDSSTSDTAAGSALISYDEVQKHTSAEDCWVIINGYVYDVTDFLQLHPGGVQAIVAQAGKDASKLFTMLHPPDALGTLPTEYCLGPVDPETLPAQEEEELSEAEQLRQEARENMPPAENMVMVQDFEDWAQKVLSETAWAYYRSAADEEMSEFLAALVDGARRFVLTMALVAFTENRDALRRYFFRPRILQKNSTEGITETTFMGIPTSVPIFISPAAMAKLGHPLGEVNLTKAAGECGIVQMVGASNSLETIVMLMKLIDISANASCGLEEMFEAKREDQSLIYQLYLNKDRAASETLIQKVEKLGAKAIVFTVDVMWQSKRTMDVRAKLPSPAEAAAAAAAPAPASVSHAISGYQDYNLTWSDLAFIRLLKKNTKLPIIVKGVQSVEDVQLCADHGVQGVILSNHGGRQADYSPAPIDILYEVRSLRPELFDKVEIMIDGGIRTGADAVKALALGAKAVGIGRPALYANGTHGEEGVKRVINIFQEEIASTMRNIGVSKIQDLKPEMVGPAGPWVGRNRPPYVP